MKGTLYILRTDNSVDAQTITDVPTLEVLQSAVDGYVETVPYFSTYADAPCVAFCNEEGKLDGLPYNQLATEVWQRQTATDDVLCGDVVIVVGDDELLRNL